MAIDVTVSGLNTVVDVTMDETALIDADSGQVVLVEDYNNLSNKPRINGITLSGNKTSSDIGVADASHTHTTSEITDLPTIPTDTSDLTNGAGFITSSDIPVTDVTLDGTSVVSSGVAALTTPTIHNVPSGGSSGQVLSKASATDYDLAWVNQSGGGASAFEAEFNVTTYADVKDAYDNDAILICTVPDGSNTMTLQLVYFDVANEIFFFAFPTSDGWYLTQLSNADGWGDGQFFFASTDVATQLADGLMSALDKQKLDGLSKRNIWYGTSSTSASSSPKAITTVSGDFELTTGSMLCVLFSHTNSLSSVSLQVDGGASKSAYAMDGTSDISNRWGSNEVVMFVYDGTKFIMLEQGKASTTAYGITKLNNTTSSTSTSEAATANAVKSAYDHGGVQSVNGSTGAVTVTVPTITDTYSGTSSDGMSGKAVKSAIDALDGTISGSAGASKTLTAFSQTDGKVSATFGNISITKSQVSDFPSLATVATSGDYDDLTDKPTIPADTGDLTNGAGFITSSDIPVTDVEVNGTSVLNSTVAEVTVPTTTSQLTNNSLFARGHIAAFHGTCATAAGTATKAVTCADFTAADLVAGAMILVTFDNTNSAAVADLKLDVNSTGAKSIKQNNSGTLSNLDSAGYLKTGTTYPFIFNGTYWVTWYNVNTNTIGYTIRTNGLQIPVKTACYRYRICFTSPDGEYLIPANASTSTSATASKTVTTEKIDPFGRIIYYSTTTAISANNSIGASYQMQQYNGVTLGYSFNRTGVALTMTAKKAVYVKCAPQTDGSAIIDSSTPFVQDLPTTEDGKIYIFLGVATAATTIEFTLEHPVYYYKNGGIRQWTNADIPTAVSQLTNDSGYLTSYTETDPVFGASAAAGISSSDITSWNGKSAVSVSQITSSGTNIADITIDGTTTHLYAPSSGGGFVTDVQVDGTSVVTAGVASVDLTGKSDVGHTHTTSAITDFPSLATVATSGSYNDLTDKPTIPTVNNATLTIQKNGTTVNTFTANASSNVTANITVPTVTDTYSGTSSDGMSGKAVKSAIDALDGTISGSAGTGKTLTAFSQTDGKVSATFGNISITKSQVSDFPTIPTITDTYSGTSQDGMSGIAVKSAIDALDGTVSGTAGAGKTLTAFSQTDGKVSATFGSISITKSQVSDFPSLATVATSGSYSDLTGKPVLLGDTSNKTPTEVQAALSGGYVVYITHNDAVYGLIGASNFNSSAAAGAIVANVVFYYSLVGLMCFELIGNLNDDTWTNNVYVLAQTSDIPTVPTNVSSFTNDAGYITGYTETDPIFTASAASGISSSDISNWNGKSNFSGDYTDLTNAPADYITEQGTSGIWTYRKWNSGIAECWGEKSWTISSWTAWNSTYYSTYSGNIAYPSALFIAKPTVMADGRTSSGDAWLASRSGGSKDETASYFFTRASNGTNNITGYVSIHAIGTWK